MNNVQLVNTEYQTYAAGRLSGKFGSSACWPLVFPFMSGKKCLDIGCSDGLCLSQLAKESVGIEQIPSLAAVARKRHLNVIEGDISDVLETLDPESFEAVLASHVLEHLECPLPILRKLARVMKQGGVLVLGLPTEHNIFKTIKRLDYFSGTHIYAFSLRNAQKLLDLAGFKCIKLFWDIPKRWIVGHRVIKSWQVLPIPFKAYFSSGYWLIAAKL